MNYKGVLESEQKINNIMYMNDLIIDKISEQRISEQNNFSRSFITLEQIKRQSILLKQVDNKKPQEPLMNNKQIEKEVLNEKRKEYESKILEFMVKTQQQPNAKAQRQVVNKSGNKRQESSKKRQESGNKKQDSGNKRQKLGTHKSTQQSSHNEDKPIAKRQMQSKHHQQDQSSSLSSKNPSTHRSKTLHRKTILTNSSTIPQQQQIPFAQNHRHLLQKIQSRIHQMNKKISQQISHEQTAMLDQYEKQLKSKQQLLNKLRQVTNQEMIGEKTIQRKEQLKTQKENLIQGNHYYSEKLQELKKEYGRLIEIRDNQRNNLKVVMVDAQGNTQHMHQQNKVNQVSDRRQSIHSSILISPSESRIPPSQTHIPPSQSHIRKSQLSPKSNHKKKPIYFSSEDYVQKVLKKYNQRTNIISQSRLEESIQSQKCPYPQPYKKHQSLLPRITQKRQLKNLNNKQVNPQLDDYYSYRKVKGKFDRAKSTGVFDSMGLSIDSRVGSIENVGEKLTGLFRYNKNSQTNSIKNEHNSKNQHNKTSINSTLNNDKSITINITATQSKPQQSQSGVNQISNTSQTPTPQNYPSNNKLQYTKQYLQQFVVKKTGKQLGVKTIPKQQNTSNRLNELQQKEQLIKEQLQPQLKIQSLFRAAADEYYRFKQRQKIMHQTTQQYGQIHQQQQQQLQDSQLNDPKDLLIIKQKPSQNNQLKSYQNNQHKSLTPIDKKRAQSLLQMKQFDKKLIMDLLLNHYQFKRYLYQLIASQFQPKNNNSLNVNFQHVLKSFQHSTIFTDTRNV